MASTKDDPTKESTMKRWMMAALASCCAASLHAADKTVELNAVDANGVGLSLIHI